MTPFESNEECFVEFWERPDTTVGSESSYLKIISKDVKRYASSVFFLEIVLQSIKFSKYATFSCGSRQSWQVQLEKGPSWLLRACQTFSFHHNNGGEVSGALVWASSGTSVNGMPAHARLDPQRWAGRLQATTRCIRSHNIILGMGESCGALFLTV